MMHDKIWNLLAKKMANQLPPEEEKELERLLQQHPDASYVKEVMMQPWHDKHKRFTPDETGQFLQRHLKRLEAAMENEAEEPEPERRGIRRMLFRITAAAAAAALLLYAGYTLWPGKTGGSGELQQLVTQSGSRSQIKLPDGTIVWLNAGSQLDYPKQFGGKQREVTLTGEAFFNVAKDAEHPFIVNTTAFSIRVLGTTFNVRAYPGEENAVTSLVSGAVEIVMDNRTVRLKPNEKLSVPTLPPVNSGLAERENIAEAPAIKSTLTEVKDSVIAETAWVENKLAFKSLPLEKVAVLLAQWYGADIRFRNEDKKHVSLTAVFEKETLTEALEALELTGSFHFKKDADGVIWIE